MSADWQLYFAIFPVYVDAYDVSEIKNGKMRYLKCGWVERRLDVWVDPDDEDRVEHRVWKFRLPKPALRSEDRP
jgi:hypothetical protein